MKAPRIIVLCGSTRFTPQMMNKMWELALQDVIAIGWNVLPNNHNADGSEVDHHLAEQLGIVDKLDELHKRKIDLADEILVINVGGYIGKSTRSEIDYANKIGVTVKYLEPI